MVLVASDRGCGPGGGGYLYAFDQKNGSLRWKLLASGPSTSLEQVDDSIVLGTREDEWLSVQLRSGKLSWSFRAGGPDSQCNVPTAPVTDGVDIYLLSRDGTIYALEPKLGRVLWKERPASPATTSLFLYKDVLYFGAADKHVYGLDPANGRKLVQLELPGTPAGRFAWGRYGEEEVEYVFLVDKEDNHSAGVLAAISDEFERVLWSRTSEREWASERPHLWKDSVIAGNCRGDFAAYRAADGIPLWSDHVKGCIRSFGHDGSMLYIGVQEGTVYAYRPPEPPSPALPPQR